VTIEEPPQRANANQDPLGGKSGTDLGQGDVAIVVEHRHYELSVSVGLE
jgi:hypothetical protein